MFYSRFDLSEGGGVCALTTCEVEKDWAGPIINHLETSYMINNWGSNRWQSVWKTANVNHVESIEANWELNLRGCSGLGGSKVLRFDGLKIKIDNMGENEAKGWSLQNGLGSGMHHRNWWSGGRSERRVHTKNHLKRRHDQHWGSYFLGTRSTCEGHSSVPRGQGCSFCNWADAFGWGMEETTLNVMWKLEVAYKQSQNFAHTNNMFVEHKQSYAWCPIKQKVKFMVVFIICVHESVVNIGSLTP